MPLTGSAKIASAGSVSSASGRRHAVRPQIGVLLVADALLRDAKRDRRAGDGGFRPGCVAAPLFLVKNEANHALALRRKLVEEDELLVFAGADGALRLFGVEAEQRVRRGT